MHDPMTQAFEIKQFWRKASDWGYKPALVTIWHVDPERDGSDDSCGWFRPRLTKDQLAAMSSIADDEAREPYFQKYFGKVIDSPTEAETLLRQAFYLVGTILHRRFGIQQVTLAEASDWACEMLANPVDNFRSSLSFLPGWHSNREEDNQGDRKQHANQLFCALAGFILRERRPWYRQVRWHFWHWHLQIHPLQNFKRWAFSHCCRCGKGFSWGYAPITGSWNSDGPRWFRGEKNVWHGDCDHPLKDCVAQAATENNNVTNNP
jgi:hypothetical protein